MLFNYMLLAIRNMRRNKFFFAINIAGLYLSLTVCTLIALLIVHDRSFDDFHPGHVFRVVAHSEKSSGSEDNAVTPYPFATAARVDIPEALAITQIHFQGEDFVRIGNEKLKQKDIIFADSAFFKVLGFKVKRGNATAALARPGTVLLTESTAVRFFGDADPIGKTIKLSGILHLEVAGILDNPPPNSHLPFSMLVSYPSLTPDFVGGLPLDQWGINSKGYVYMRLPENYSAANIRERLQHLANKYLNDRNEAEKTSYSLQAVQDIHFNKSFADSNPAYTISGEYLYWLGAIGLFLMIIACINYINLSTAFGLRRSLEVGVRKTMGAQRTQLTAQFLTETSFLSTTAILLVGFSIRGWLPILNNFLERNIPLEWLNLHSFGLLAGLCLLTALLSGLYPAFVLSGYSPVAAIKVKNPKGSKNSLQLRRSLVVFQFAIAQIFIIGVVVAALQMQFIRNRPLGFQKEQILDLALPEAKPEQLSALRSKLMDITGVQAVSFSLGAPTSNNGFGTDFNLRERYSSEKLQIEAKIVDRYYAETYGLKMVSGRYFNENDERQIDPSVPDDKKQYSLVLNETAVKKLGFPSPELALGQQVTFGLNDISAPVIGVVKDFHVESLHEPIQPVLMIQFPIFVFNAGLKLSPNMTSSSLSAIQSAWESVYPDRLYNPEFLDEHLSALYRSEARLFGLIQLLALLALFINALGLIGLVSFMVEQKRKEIGIRKVLGASVASITGLVSREFLRLMLLAILLASPIAWYFMQQWLADFAYRIDLQWWMFAGAALLALVIAFLTLGFQAVKAALSNPVDALRNN